MISLMPDAVVIPRSVINDDSSFDSMFNQMNCIIYYDHEIANALELVGVDSIDFKV